MTCRDEILQVARKIVLEKGQNEFTILDIIDGMRRNNSRYEDSTIRTNVVSRLCANAPKNHAVKFDDFERIDHGIYRLRNFSN